MYFRAYGEEEEVWGLQWMHSTLLWSVQQLQCYEKVCLGNRKKSCVSRVCLKLSTTPRTLLHVTVRKLQSNCVSGITVIHAIHTCRYIKVSPIH